MKNYKVIIARKRSEKSISRHDSSRLPQETPAASENKDTFKKRKRQLCESKTVEMRTQR